MWKGYIRSLSPLGVDTVDPLYLSPSVDLNISGYQIPQMEGLRGPPRMWLEVPSNLIGRHFWFAGQAPLHYPQNSVSMRGPRMDPPPISRAHSTKPLLMQPRTAFTAFVITSHCWHHTDFLVILRKSLDLFFIHIVAQARITNSILVVLISPIQMQSFKLSLLCLFTFARFSTLSRLSGFQFLSCRVVVSPSSSLV